MKILLFTAVLVCSLRSFSQSGCLSLFNDSCSASTATKKTAEKNQPEPAYKALFEQQKKNYLRLPEDFRKELGKLNYQRLLTKVSDRSAKHTVALWNETYDFVLQNRIRKIDKKIESETKIRENFRDEVYSVLWEDSDAWKRVLRSFDETKAAYSAYFDSSKEMSDELKNLRKKDIADLKLLPPWKWKGIESRPKCLLTSKNALYIPSAHAIVFCAGDFSRPSGIDATMSHEFAHAVGIGRRLYQFKEGTELQRKFADLDTSFCAANENTCEQWSDFKAKVSDRLGELSNFKVEDRQLRTCLQYRADRLKDLPPDRPSQADAEAAVGDRLNRLAKKKTLSTVAKAIENSEAGKTKRRCGGLKAHSDFTNALPLYFALEYSCLKQKDRKQKFQAAVQAAKEIEMNIFRSIAVVGGRFSTSKWMGSRDFAENSEERFADFLGYKVMAYRMSKLATTGEKLKYFIENTAHRCTGRSEDERFELEKEEHELAIEPHSIPAARKMEIFIPEIREQLNCKKDFESTDCKF